MMICFAFTEFMGPGWVLPGSGQSGNAMMSNLGFSRLSLRQRQEGVAVRAPVHETSQLQKGMCV
jgi:hypothetical protein